jgi:hypothetical protein
MALEGDDVLVPVAPASGVDPPGEARDASAKPITANPASVAIRCRGPEP